MSDTPTLSATSGVSAHQDPDPTPEDRIETDGTTLIAEPPSGFTIRARYLMHHTAAMIFTRDDREGHGDPPQAPEHWWSHDQRRWMSWADVQAFAVADDMMVLEPLYASPPLPGCPPDGAHLPGDLCPAEVC